MQCAKWVGMIGVGLVAWLAGGNASQAQVTLDPAWPENPKTVRGALSIGDSANSVQQTSDGGYIVAGTGGSFSYQGALILKLAPARHFLRGDRNGDGDTGGAQDALWILTRNFVDATIETPCLAACDVNGNGDITGVQDALELLTNNFLGGLMIPPPHPACGAGQLWTDGPLGCETELECN